MTAGQSHGHAVRQRLSGNRAGRGPRRRFACGARRLARGEARDQGTAVIELGLFFLVVLVPLLYVMFTAATIQRTMLGTASAAREAARVYVTANTMADGSHAASVAADDVLGDYGIGSAERATLQISCVPNGGGACAPDLSADRGAEIVVTVRCAVPLGRIPLLGLVTAPYLPVSAVERARVDRFRGF